MDESGACVVYGDKTNWLFLSSHSIVCSMLMIQYRTLEKTPINNDNNNNNNHNYNNNTNNNRLFRTLQWWLFTCEDQNLFLLYNVV